MTASQDAPVRRLRTRAINKESFGNYRKIIGGLLSSLVLLALLPASANAYPRPGITERVSVASDGTAANSHADRPAISPDGRYVAFESWASNLVPGDTNGASDVFVYDRIVGTTEQVSVSSDGAQADSGSGFPTISADGRYVAFQSTASNLVPGDTNGRADVFVHDRATGTTERVSVASNGAQANGSSSSNSTPAISGDGRYITFHSLASNLVPGGTTIQDVYVHDRVTETTERVSVDSTGGQANGYSYDPAISADGRYVAFVSLADNLVPGDTNRCSFTGCLDVFVRDRARRTTDRVSVASDGAQANSYSLQRVAISSDGRYVAFGSDASNLIPKDTNGRWDVFVHDRATGTTERVSVASDGAQANRSSSSYDDGPAISTDGRYIAFHSDATNLVPGDTKGARDVFVHDRATGTTERVSRAPDGTESSSTSAWPAISVDARYVAFHRMTDDQPPHRWETFVRERGPVVGVGELSAVLSAGRVSVSGWATFAGAVVASATDPPDDGGPGADLTEGSLTYRPELEDLLIRLRLVSLPAERCTSVQVEGVGTLHSNVCEEGGGVPGVVSPGVLYRRLLYGMAFEVGGTLYEVRARPGSTYRNLASTGADPVNFALFQCDPDCTEQALLTGGIGTTGVEIRVPVPLSAVGASEGLTLTQVRAFISREESATEAEETIDDAALPDATIPAARVSVGIAPAGTPEGAIDFNVPATLTDGNFAEAVDVSSLASGDYELWARACLGADCGPAEAAPVTLGDGTSPNPTPSVTSTEPTPIPTPTGSPERETTEVAFTERSATSGQQGEETLFEARLTDHAGEPIADAELTFELTGSESSRDFTAVTDEAGVASVTPTLEEPPGPYQLTVRYAGDDRYEASADTTAFVVNPPAGSGNRRCRTGNPIVGQTVDNVVVPTGESCTLTGSTVTGNVKAEEDSTLHASDNTIKGNVEGDKAEKVVLVDNDISGNVTIKEGETPDGDDVVIADNVLSKGSIKVEKMAGDISITDNTVAEGNVEVIDNTIGQGYALVVDDNHIAKNSLKVEKNNGAGDKSVTDNEGGQALECKDNDDPFTGSPNGTWNKKEGQCRP